MCTITRAEIEDSQRQIKKEKNAGSFIGGLIFLVSFCLWICPKTFWDVELYLGFDKNFIASGIPLGLFLVYLIPYYAKAQSKELEHIYQRHTQDEKNDEICNRYFEILKTPIIIAIIPKLKLK